MGKKNRQGLALIHSPIETYKRQGLDTTSRSLGQTGPVRLNRFGPEKLIKTEHEVKEKKTR